MQLEKELISPAIKAYIRSVVKGELKDTLDRLDKIEADICYLVKELDDLEEIE